VAGDYVLTPRFKPSRSMSNRKPWDQPPHSYGVVKESYSFVLRHLSVPYGRYIDGSSKLMVQP
jgi:hypothetical protein